MSGDITPKEPPPPRSKKKSEGLGCFVRLLWMGAGNIGLISCLLVIARDSEIKMSFTWIDGVFWSIALLMIGARYYDITRLGGLTASNQPATMKHFWRYLVLLVILGFFGWAGAHIISHYSLI